MPTLPKGPSDGWESRDIKALLPKPHGGWESADGEADLFAEYGRQIIEEAIQKLVFSSIEKTVPAEEISGAIAQAIEKVLNETTRADGERMGFTEEITEHNVERDKKHLQTTMPTLESWRTRIYDMPPEFQAKVAAERQKLQQAMKNLAISKEQKASLDQTTIYSILESAAGIELQKRGIKKPSDEQMRETMLEILSRY